MNNQYSQYPPPSYNFPTGAYPQQQQAPYLYQQQAAVPQQQPPPQQPIQQQQSIPTPQQQQFLQHNFVPRGPPPQQEGPPQTNPPPPPSSRPIQKRRGPLPRSQANRAAAASRQNVASDRSGSPQNGPGAPAPEPITPDNIEEELMNALGGDHQNASGQGVRDQSDDEDQDGEVDGNEPVFHLLPPPEGNYANEKELEEQMHIWSLDHGYEVVRRASKKNARGGVYKRYYHCSRHGKTGNSSKIDESNRKRAKRKTGRLGCPMSLAAVALDPQNPSGEWQIRHRKTHHNHAAEDPLALTGHRRRARGGDVEKVIDSLFAIGTPTSQILKFLEKNHPGGLFTRTDVANLKLKFNKWGTCVKDAIPERSVTAGKGGVPSACQRCRAKRVKCDSVRPFCGTCIKDGDGCEYDHDPVHVPDAESSNQAPHTNITEQTGAGALQTMQSTLQQQQQRPGRTPRQPPQTQEEFEHAQRIMSEFQSFHADHVRPTRLTLESSVVELTASSSCGNGDLYKTIPTLNSIAEWQTYSSAIIEASMKENTIDVLTGIKPEPTPPASDCDVEVWNEYIKQFAIYKRRNDMLLAAIWATLPPSFKTRVSTCKSASQAWNLVEDMCQPRGSDQAFRLYADLQAITLQTSRDLNDYTQRIEQAYMDLMRAKLYLQPAHDSIGIQPSSSTGTGTNGRSQHNNSLPIPSKKTTPRFLADPIDVFPEESLCFLFLMNLGPTYRPWAETICATSNVGGFGTGTKIGFRELSRRAIEWDSTRRRSGGGYSRM